MNISNNKMCKLATIKYKKLGYYLTMTSLCDFSWYFRRSTQRRWTRTTTRSTWRASSATRSSSRAAISSRRTTPTAYPATRSCSPITARSARNPLGLITRWVSLCVGVVDVSTTCLSDHMKWRLVATKCGKLCNVIAHHFIWTNKIT